MRWDDDKRWGEYKSEYKYHQYDLGDAVVMSLFVWWILATTWERQNVLIYFFLFLLNKTLLYIFNKSIEKGG